MAKRRGNNEGSIYKDRRGFNRGAVTLPDGSRRFVSAKTREQCKDKLVELQATLAEGLPSGDTDVLAPFLAWWLGRLEAKAGSGKKSANTVDNARWAVEK